MFSFTSVVIIVFFENPAFQHVFFGLYSVESNDNERITKSKEHLQAGYVDPKPHDVGTDRLLLFRGGEREGGGGS